MREYLCLVRIIHNASADGIVQIRNTATSIVALKQSVELSAVSLMIDAKELLRLVSLWLLCARFHVHRVSARVAHTLFSSS